MAGTVGVVLLVLSSLGCEPSGEPTQIMAQVYWDLTPEQFDHVAIRVFQMRPEVEVSGQCTPPVVGAVPSECMTLDEHYYVHRWTGVFAAGEERVQPIEVGIAPRERDAARIAFIEAFALRCADATCEDYAVVTRTAARTRFVERRISNVVLWLSRSCIGVVCPSEHDCRLGACQPRDFSPECTSGGALVDAGPGAPPRCDEGPGVPPVGDGGVRDTGLGDVGPSDAGPPDAAPPDGGGSCPGECSPGEPDSRGCGDCGTERRTCGSDCRWGEFGSCQGEGECRRGSSAGCSAGFDCFGCPSGCCTTTCCRDCNGSCSWEWVCEMACVDEAFCVNIFGNPVCDGQIGSNQAGCSMGQGRICRCSAGTWTECEMGCRVL